MSQSIGMRREDGEIGAGVIKSLESYRIRALLELHTWFKLTHAILKYYIDSNIIPSYTLKHCTTHQSRPCKYLRLTFL